MAPLLQKQTAEVYGGAVPIPDRPCCYLIMRCYFWGTNNHAERDHRGNGVLSFAIPDWGVQFRAAQAGTATECEYGGLLALLHFVVTNPRVFEKMNLEILSDAAAVVYQVNRQTPVPPAEARQWALVRRLRDKRPFDLIWIPSEQNPAIHGVLDLAPLKMKTPLIFPSIEKSRSRAAPPPDKPLL